MFFRMVFGVLKRQKGKMLMVALTIALGSSLVTAMLNVVMDVGDKVNQELKAYGANINVVPRGESLIGELYGTDDNNVKQFLNENDLPKIKTVFWAYNIVDFTPYLDENVIVNNNENKVKLVGTWFNRNIDLDTGGSVNTGIFKLRRWWDINGDWISDSNVKGLPDETNAKEYATFKAMVGKDLSKSRNIKIGDTINVKANNNSIELKVVGIINSGSEEDDQIFTDIITSQILTGDYNKISRAEVSALTTPDNELSRRAAKHGPKSLSIADYETWYCTAYVSSICYQIEEVVKGSRAKAIRMVAESEGEILNKTQLMMLLITLLSLIGSSLAISNLVTASVIERSREIGLLKAIGATDFPIISLILLEILIVGIIGGIFGYFMGLGFAQIIGKTVFGSAIAIKPMVIPLDAVLIFVVTILGSIPSIKMLLKLKPAEVLHGR